MLRRILVALVVLALGTGAFVYVNKDTRHDVVMRHADRFENLRRQLRDLNSKMPSPPERDGAACPGVPAGAQLFRYDDDRPAGTNTGMVTYEQLQNPAALPGKWDIIVSSLAKYVAAASPGYRPTEADDEWASDKYVRSVEAMAKIRYVVVVRLGRVNGPGDDGPNDYGYMNSVSNVYLGFDAVVADLPAQKILCVISGTAGIDRDVWYGYPRGAEPDVRSQRAEEAIEDSLRSAGTTELEKQLNGLGHGRFTFDLLAHDR